MKKALQEFKLKVSKDFPVSKMIFFGSRVKGKAHRDSDIDLIIISEKFKKLNFIERAARMYDYWNLNYPVDFLCYTPKEFNLKRKQISIVREAVKTGIGI